MGRQRGVFGMMLVCCMLIMAGCGGEDGPAGPTPTPEPTLPPLTLENIVWAEGVDPETGEPVGEVDAYTTTSPAIVAVVRATNVPAGTELIATWTIDGLDVPEATMNVVVEEDMSTAWAAFEFVRAEGRYFPLGELEITVTASTGERISGTVTIGLP